MITGLEKEKIISEYLSTNITYRALGLKCGVDHRTLFQWVQVFQGKVRNRNKNKKLKLDPQEDQLDMPSDVKLLQAELRKTKLHNKLLNAMIDIAEEQLKIDIRKKSGTKH